MDPGRKSDPINSFKLINKTYENFLLDVVNEYNSCIAKEGDVEEKELNKNNDIMKTIQNKSSKKIYAIDKKNKKHWIFNFVNRNFSSS